jgi:hypothetical protein
VKRDEEWPEGAEEKEIITDIRLELVYLEIEMK